MPTNNKTANLSLNNWLETDKPKRIDFVENNTILDTVIGTHIADQISHLSSADRALLSAPFVRGVIAGTGDATYAHALDISPKFVIVFMRNRPFFEHDTTNGYTICNCGIALTSAYGSSSGLSLSGSNLTLKQTTGTPSDGIFFNLNKYNEQYVYIAFK